MALTTDREWLIWHQRQARHYHHWTQVLYDNEQWDEAAEQQAIAHQARRFIEKYQANVYGPDVVRCWSCGLLPNEGWLAIEKVSHWWRFDGVAEDGTLQFWGEFDWGDDGEDMHIECACGARIEPTEVEMEWV